MKKKPKKEKQPKKEKKPKKPKEPAPKEKKLPRKPVILIWVMALSLFLLIYIGSNLVGYSTVISVAQERYDKGDYVGSYSELVGTKVKEADQELYQKAFVLAGVQTELDAYYALMEVRKYDLALDCLVRGLGRAELASADAQEWNVETQMGMLVEEIVKQLQDQFNVTKEQAAELYAIDDRDEYSLELDAILKELGLK